MKIFRSLKQRYWKIFLFAVIIFSTLYNCAERRKFRSLGCSLYSKIESKPIPWKIWAKSVEKRNIRFIEIGNGKHTTLIFGAFHGSEPLSAELATRFAEYLFDEYKNELNGRVIIVPIVNPDGLTQGVRTNANGVDINRNFPTKNWQRKMKFRKHLPGKYPASEPETKAVIRLIKKFKPDRIVSIHTPLRLINYDGPARELAIRMAMFNGYKITKNIGRNTSGSLEFYTGVQLNIPTIMLELPMVKFNTIWKENKDALLITLIY